MPSSSWAIELLVVVVSIVLFFNSQQFQHELPQAKLGEAARLQLYLFHYVKAKTEAFQRKREQAQIVMSLLVNKLL